MELDKGGKAFYNIAMISDAKLQERIKWEPHERQEEVLRVFNNLRTIVLCAGRRFGKSALCAYLALKVLLGKNKKVWIVSPSYDLSLKVFNYLVRWFSIVAPSQTKGITYRPTPKIKTARGSILECKSAENPTSLLGEELDLMIVDEAARIDRRIYEQFLFPTLSSRQGKVVFISTPLGKNWFYEQYEKAREMGGAFTFPSKDNPTFPQEEWEYSQKNLPDHVFQQEYQAQFLDDSTAVFRGVDECIKETISDPREGRVYTMGVDLGKYRDYTVLTVIDHFNNEVVYIDRFKDVEWELQKKRIVTLAERYNRARVVIDSTGLGDPIADYLRKEGLFVEDISYSQKRKQQLIEKLSIFIQEQLVTIPPDEQLLAEMKSFGYNLNDGRVSYSAPSGMHDDCVNSLALAVWLLQKPERETAIQKELKKAKPKNNQSFV